MHTNERDYIRCDHCEEKYHPVGSNYCPYSGKRLIFNDDERNIRIKSEGQVIDEISGILAGVSEGNRGIRDFLYIDPRDIPERKLKKIIRKFELKEDERFLGLIDLSGGPLKNCLLFGKTGIYYNNFWSSKEPGAHFIDYRDFFECDFQLTSAYEIAVGPNHILDVRKFSDANDVKDGIIRILNTIKKNIFTG